MHGSSQPMISVPVNSAPPNVKNSLIKESQMAFIISALLIALPPLIALTQKKSTTPEFPEIFDPSDQQAQELQQKREQRKQTEILLEEKQNKLIKMAKDLNQRSKKDKEE